MASDPRFRSLWDEDELIPYPRKEWLEQGFPSSMLPEGDEIPLDVAVVYTSYLEGAIKMFQTLRLTAEDSDLDIRLIVVGAVADNPNLLYVLDPKTGEVLQFDLVEQDIQGVNSTFRLFVEFLWQFALFIEADEGKSNRRARALELRDALRALDPNAFHDNGWWPLVIDQLR